MKSLNLSNLFKVTKEAPKASLIKTANEVIDEIHESFYTEVDRLLAEAKILKPTSDINTDILAKAERLKALGFTAAKEIKDSESIAKEKRAIELENTIKTNLVKAITYFTDKYPMYKFITEESVKKICMRYGLIYGEIDRYLGTVPDKNLEDIENFKVLEDDECYVSTHIYESHLSDYKDVTKRHISKLQYEDIEARKLAEFEAHHNNHTARIQGIYVPRLANPPSRTEDINMKCPLEICAPLSDFNTKDMEVKDFKLVKTPIPVLDPVVLKPVIFNGTKYYLIITAWGQEANDEIVINPKHN